MTKTESPVKIQYQKIECPIQEVGGIKIDPMAPCSAPAKAQNNGCGSRLMACSENAGVLNECGTGKRLLLECISEHNRKVQNGSKPSK